MTTYNKYTTEYNEASESYDKYKQDFDNQEDVINKRNKQMVPDTYDTPYEKMYTANAGIIGTRHTPDYENLKNRKSDRYDPIGDYLYKKGDRNFSSITRYKTHYINIDSRLRQKNPVYKRLDYVQMPPNCLTLTNNSDILEIYINNAIILSPNDKISLKGLYNNTVKLRILSTNTFFEFTISSNYVKVNYPHGLYFNNLDDLLTYDSNDMFIEFSGITGNAFNNTFIGNIPVNSLNNVQRVYLYNPEDNSHSNDYFFIKLVRPFSGLSAIPDTMDIKLTYYYTTGIANNNINSQYPVNNLNAQGYLLIDSVSSDNKYAYVKLKKTSHFNNSKLSFGGNNICISLLSEIYSGYPNPTNYTIFFDKTFNNIVQMRLISSEFPILDRVIYEYTNASDYKPYNLNNKLYWQNLDDGDKIYSIEIQQGNYNLDDLIKITEEYIYNTKRTSNNMGNYIDNNIIKITQSSTSKELLFSSYKIAILVEPVVNITLYDASTSSYTITINHPNHLLEIGSEITISGSIDTSGIPASYINNVFAITNIIDDDNYEIVIKNINFTGDTTDSKGGNNVNIQVQNIFRLLFNYEDTLGGFFGFRNLSNSQSITKYNSIISNRDLYNNEYLDQNLLGYSSVDKKYVIRSIDLENDNYILMTCDSENVPTEIINQMLNYSKINNVFAKILFNNFIIPTNTPTIFNSYVQAPMWYHNPIDEIKQLSFKFYDKYGNLLEYSDFEHSFTLEITTIDEIPENTYFMSRYPKVN